MLSLLRALVAGRLLPHALRRQMDQGCLGWDCQPEQTSPYRLKGSSFTRDDASFGVLFGLLMDRVPIVVVVNSDPGDLDRILATAVTDAIVR